jgi:diketogulonate reductase-like aldo/keto reductase
MLFMDIKSAVKLNNGVAMPLLGLGVWKIPHGRECENAVLAALSAGYRHIDTAAVYGNEKSVGSAIKKSGLPRDQIFVTTKLWNDDHDDPEAACNASLGRLSLDYIDLYLVHWPVPERNATWTILEKLLEQGKCRAIGVSNFTIHHLGELLRKSKIIPAVNQIEFNPFLYQKELLEFCTSNRIVLEAYSPLGHGKSLSDPKLVAIAKKCGKSPAQMLIRWALQHSVIAIPKSSDPGHIKQNADVFDFSISAQDMKLMNNFNRNLRTCWDPTGIP